MLIKLFFSDGAASQFKNRYIIEYLTNMMDKFDIEFSWNYFSSSHGKGVVDSIGGTLKRLVRMDVMADARCSSAKEFINICKRKTRTIIVSLVQQAQFDTTEALLKICFQNIVGVPNIRKQHHISVLHKDVIEYPSFNKTRTPLLKMLNDLGIKVSASLSLDILGELVDQNHVNLRASNTNSDDYEFTNSQLPGYYPSFDIESNK
ncbi:unnamed protein product [Rotaria magnacalcarata]